MPGIGWGGLGEVNMGLAVRMRLVEVLFMVGGESVTQCVSVFDDCVLQRLAL